MERRGAADGDFWEVWRELPADFEPYGERVWDGPPAMRPECADCRSFLELQPTWPDWGVCLNARSPRAGLLTFCEQGCEGFEPETGPHGGET